MLSSDAPHVAVNGRAGADLALALGGVNLPWPVLGASVGEPVTGRVGVLVSPQLTPSLAPGGSLVLTEETSLPVARLLDVEVTRTGGTGTDNPDEAAVAGELTTYAGAPAAPAWRRPARRVVLAARPLLRGELDRWVPSAEEDSAAADVPGVLVLVPTGPSPDRIPGDLLRRTLQWAAGIPGVVVESIPLAWRDTASDSALVKALGDRLGRPVDVLEADDPAWVSSLEALSGGRPTDELDELTSDALVAWRPPPAQRGVVVFFTGLSGSGKSSLADALVQHLRTSTPRTVTLLDGDVVRLVLSSGLGFDRLSRDLNIRRIGYVAAEIARHRGMTVCAPIAPFAETRDAVRQMVEQFGDFVLIHVSTPLEECERRDRKGLYARARAGLLPDFTGISSPYESPTNADLVVDTTGRTLEESLGEVVGFLESKGWIPRMVHT